MCTNAVEKRMSKQEQKLRTKVFFSLLQDCFTKVAFYMGDNKTLEIT